MPDADNLVVTPDTQDNYVGAEVNLSFGETMRSGSVKIRASDSEGEVYFGPHVIVLCVWGDH